MRVMILGADGYIGWPLTMYLSRLGHEVMAIDNGVKRDLEKEVGGAPLIPVPPFMERVGKWLATSGCAVGATELDVSDIENLSLEIAHFDPEAIVHLAEQPSGPYSMMGYEEASYTLDNNVAGTLSLIHAVLETVPDAHIVKLGTMGEYGTPGVPIPEGWMDLWDKLGNIQSQRLFPREAGSLYHTCKILETDLLHFYVRMRGLKVTDLMQGPVYGITTDEMSYGTGLHTSFHYDDIFGTVLNRFIAQAVSGHPLTVYGQGGQVRGYLSLEDSLRCIELAILNPPEQGELKVMNQFTQLFSVATLAIMVADAAEAAGLGEVEIREIPNPRIEEEQHTYEVTHTALLELGLEPSLLTPEVLGDMLVTANRWKETVDPELIMPRVTWKGGAQ